MANENGWNEDRPPIGRGGGDDADFWRNRRDGRHAEHETGDHGRRPPNRLGAQEQQREIDEGARRYGGAAYQSADHYPDVYGGRRDQALDAARPGPQGWDRPRAYGQGAAEEKSFSPYDQDAARFRDEGAQKSRFADPYRSETGAHRGRGPKGYARSDERISEEVHDVLTENAQIDATNVTVQVAAGEVTLNGHVSSRQDKRRAEDLIERLSGVKHVQNNLRVHDSNYNAATATAGGPAASGPTDGASGLGRTSGQA